MITCLVWKYGTKTYIIIETPRVFGTMAFWARFEDFEPSLHVVFQVQARLRDPCQNRREGCSSFWGSLVQHLSSVRKSLLS